MIPAKGPDTMRDPIPKTRRTSDSALRAMVGVGTAILVVAALGVAQPVFAPLTFALFIIAIVWPLQSWLQARLPKLVALAVSILVTIVVIGAFAWVSPGGSTGSVATSSPTPPGSSSSTTS